MEEIIEMILAFGCVWFLFDKLFQIYRNKTLYIVLSRDDSDFIYITDKLHNAVNVRSEQIYNEEMRGGRPSVYIRERIVNKLK